MDWVESTIGGKEVNWVRRTIDAFFIVFVHCTCLFHTHKDLWCWFAGNRKPWYSVVKPNQQAKWTNVLRSTLPSIQATNTSMGQVQLLHRPSTTLATKLNLPLGLALFLAVAMTVILTTCKSGGRWDTQPRIRFTTSSSWYVHFYPTVHIC